ncbi:MAG: hypothetical protein AAGC55_23060 [Myxococcota bacterium]
MTPLQIDMAIALALWLPMALWFGRLVRPHWKVIGKAAFYFAVAYGLARAFGHWSLLFILGHPVLGLLGHLAICRKHAIDWWTCEPRERYLAAQTQWAERFAERASE